VTSELSRAATAAKFEMGWYWVTTRENAATTVENAIADWVITPNSISPRMKAGAMIRAGIIWIIQL
jgi:hypothetical protein